MEEISYRLAVPTDAGVLTEMRYEFLSGLSSELDKNELEQFKSQLLKYFEDKLKESQMVVWLAESGGSIVASSTMVVWQAPIGFSGINKNGSAYVLNMFTKPAYRKMGIASRLLKKLRQSAEEMELEKLHLHATDDGISMYKKEGFQAPQYPELTLKL